MKNKLLMFFFLMFGAGTAVAATNTCDQEGYDFINPALALCEVHAYNIGNIENPSASERELLREVIAMKTTVITKQMYRQYEQMESMLQRLKTQLEKAVLTANLKVAAGESSYSGLDVGGDDPYSVDKANHINGVNNCLNVFNDQEKLDCYKKNLDVILYQSGQGNNPSSELKKQLANDFERLAEIDFEGNGKSVCNYDKNTCGRNMKNKDFKDECLNAYRTCLGNQYRSYERFKMSYKKD